MDYWFFKCLLCGHLWCKHKDCQAPNCKVTCIKELTHLNTNFQSICSVCRHNVGNEFERQFRKELK